MKNTAAIKKRRAKKKGNNESKKKQEQKVQKVAKVRPPDVFFYARVSSADQDESRQVQAALERGVQQKNIYIEKASGASFDRPVLQRLLKILQHGDTLIIQDLDRFGRRFVEGMVEWFKLKVKGIRTVVLDMPMLGMEFDADSDEDLLAQGFLMFKWIMAELEYRANKRRQSQGIASAQARGVRFGRPELPTPEGYEDCYQRYIRKEITGTAAARQLHMSPSTFYHKAKKRYLAEQAAAREALLQQILPG